MMDALANAGHRVEVASTFRTYDGEGDAARQAALRAQGEMLAAELAAQYNAMPAGLRPQLWFTYHLYYKAPDWLGPGVSRALGIPYVIAEASHAEKRAKGAWRRRKSMRPFSSVVKMRAASVGFGKRVSASL